MSAGTSWSPIACAWLRGPCARPLRSAPSPGKRRWTSHAPHATRMSQEFTDEAGALAPIREAERAA